MQTPLREPGAAKLERKLRCRLEVERVERLERAGQVAVGRGHDRPRAWQRRIDPDPRKRRGPSASSRASVSRARSTSPSCDQQLDVERLGAIEQPVLDADLIEQLAHVRQRAIGCRMITRGKLDEPEHARAGSPPTTPSRRCSGLLDEWPQRRSGAIEPAPMSVDQRSPGKRVGEPAAHLQPLFDRVAAVLDQLLGELAPAGLELDKRQVREPFSPMGLIAVVAGPLGFSDMPFCGCASRSSMH